MLTAPDIFRSLPILTACVYPYSFSTFGRKRKYSGAYALDSVILTYLFTSVQLCAEKAIMAMIDMSAN
jgi:hypothetical protein